MKRNRLLQYLMAGLALLTSACNEQEDVTPLGDQTALRAVISDDEQATRSIVIDNPGIKLESFWKAGDMIGVSGSSEQNVSFSVSEENISADGKTADFKATTGIPSGSLMAYYPYSANAVSTSDGFTLDFPATQHYTEVDHVSQPDPQACIMVGSGSSNSGINFVNVMAVLKVGQVYAKETVVRSVEFRDLSGTPVCGAFTVTMNGGNLETTFTGNGDVLTLDLGIDGLTANEDALFTVFLVVPARHYPKGFEVTFIDADGQKIVKTAGSRQGKTLNRSVVYPVGDITTYKNIPGITYELKPNAQIMTPDKLDLVTVINSDKTFVKTDDGERAVDYNGNPVTMPHLTMMVHKDMNPQEGGYLIFNQPSTDLPQGGVYKVEQCKPMADGEHYEVYAVPEADFAAPFEELTIGEPLYDSEGNFNPDGGIDIDISSYIKEIRDGDGNVVSVRSMQPNYEMNVAEQMTRGTSHSSFTTKTLTLSMDDEKHCTCDVSAKMKVNMRMSVGVISGELQYVYYVINPNLELKTTFALYSSWSKDERKHIWTFYTSPIGIPPIVLLPEVSFDAICGIGGEVKFSASTTFNYDLGNFGLAYNKGDGLSVRRVYKEPEKQDNFMPELDASFTGQLYAYGGIGMRAGISVYGLCSLGAAIDGKLTFGIANETNHQNENYGRTKLHLTPEVDIAPYTAVLGGKLAHVWKGLTGKIEFDPLWERWLSPKVENPSTSFFGQRTETMDIEINSNMVAKADVMTSIDGVNYEITLKDKVLIGYDVAIDIYEGDVYYVPMWGKEEFALYEAAGVPFINGWPYLSNPTTLLARHIVGKYPSGTESMTFKGKYNHYLPPSPIGDKRGYCAGITLINGTNETPVYNAYGQGSVAAIYYWPTRANGQPYKSE